MFRTALCKRSFSSVKAAELVPKLESILGSAHVTTSEAVRDHHGHDESHHRNCPPDVVVVPQNVAQVSEIAKLCNETRTPLIPFGTGTGVEGGVNALQGGVTVDLTAMAEITEVHVDDFDCVVQPGVTRKALNASLRDTGLWFSVDPGADASVCGMVATGASGKKTSAGYNLTQLFVGSEGTLGLITSACVKLHARPAYLSAAMCSFPNVTSAVQSVVETLQSSIPIARIEFLDASQVDACNKYSKLDMSVAPTLFLEFHGSSESEVAEQAKLVEDICHGNEGGDFKWSTEQAEMDRLWTARHNAYYAALNQRPGHRGFTTDVAVPISALAQIVDETRKDIDASGMFGTIVGHVGDGNFHCIFPVDEEDEKERREIQRLCDNVVERALAVGGTCTGEHGIGIGKVKHLRKELGETTFGLMKAVKSTLDPNSIMNPGKVFAA